MQVDYLKGVQVMVTINIQCISNSTDDVCFMLRVVCLVEHTQEK